MSVECAPAFRYTTFTAPPNETLQEKKARQRGCFKERMLERKLRLFQEALYLACSREITSDPTTWDATFSIGFPTHFGQDLFLVGSCPELGEWDANKAVAMTWGEDNLWSVSLPLPRSLASIEYKYIVKQHGDVNWEWGQNHTIRFDREAARQCVFDAWGAGGV